MAGRLPYERCMTLPRRVEPGKRYLCTRRCILRSFLLTPCDEVNQVLLYTLGLYQPQFGIELHAVTALSNHMHLVLTDVLGVLPEFFLRVNGTIARALNVFRCRRDSFWEGKPYGRVELLDDGTVIDKMVYVAANPVAAGLVDRGEKWPGIRLFPDASGRVVIRVTKPEFFFREEDGLPDEVEVVIERPKTDDDVDHGEFAAQLDEAIGYREKELRGDAADGGRSFLGVQRVKEQDPFARPTTEEAIGGINPLFASRNKETVHRAKAEHAEWVDNYADALVGYLRRDRDVVFPSGAWWMRVFHKVRCESSP